MDDILDLASKLGKLIATDPRGKQMAEAKAALDNSLEDRQLVEDLEKQQQKLQELAAGGKPIEPEEKRRLADLHAKVAASPVIKELLKAQTDYVTLMSMVSQRIEQEAMASSGTT